MADATFIKLRKLTLSDDEPIEDVVTRGAEGFRSMVGTATVELRLIEADGTKARTSFTVEHTPAGQSVYPRGAHQPDFVAITTPETFRRMADGAYSPFQAFLDGHLKVHGNMEIGRTIVGHLAPEGGGATTVNPMLANESYNPAGPDGGSLTLSGCGFTPGGSVLIIYNYGSGQYEAAIDANATGEFLNFLQPGIGCGDIPGHPGVGVIVTATDLTTGKTTTQNYATPC